jgi:hypothetical protein
MIDKTLNPNLMPLNTSEFYKRHRVIEEEILKILYSSTKELVDTNKILVLKEELIEVF